MGVADHDSLHVSVGIVYGEEKLMTLCSWDKRDPPLHTLGTGGVSTL